MFITSLILFAVAGYWIWWGHTFSEGELAKEAGVDWLFFAVLGIGCFLLVPAIVGIVIALFLEKHWQKRALAIYTFFMFLVTVLLITAGIGMLYVYSFVKETFNNREDCRSVDFLRDADDELFYG
jgi:hypothetical protein